MSQDIFNISAKETLQIFTFDVRKLNSKEYTDYSVLMRDRKGKKKTTKNILDKVVKVSDKNELSIQSMKV